MTWRLVLVLCVVSGCGNRFVGQNDILDAGIAETGPVDAADVPDAEKSLPWVSTYAGSTCGFLKAGSQLHDARFGAVRDVLVEPTGNVLFATSGTVLRGVGTILQVVAGQPAGVYGDGPTSKAGFDGIQALALGSDGSIYVAETNSVRRILKGQVTTFAGKYKEKGHVDGPVGSSRFAGIREVALDVDGSLLVGDVYYVRRISGGKVTTIAGNGKRPKEYPLHSDGAALVSFLSGPSSLLVGSDGILLDDSGALLRRLSQGKVSTLMGTEEAKSPFARDGSSNVARFFWIKSLTRFKGTMYFVNGMNGRVRSIVNGEVKTLNMPSATDGKLADVGGLRDGPLKQALFNGPWAVAPDAKGNLYVADAHNCRVRYVKFR